MNNTFYAHKFCGIPHSGCIKFLRINIMEVISMTEIGKMIYEDGKSKSEEEGLIRGKVEGKAEVLIKQLAKKIKSIPQDYIDKIKKCLKLL